MKDTFCVDQLSFVKHVTNVPTVVSNLPVGARLQNCWKTWEDLGAGPKVVQILQRRLHPPLSDPAKLDKVTHHHKLVCQSPQETLPVGGITSAYGQKRNRIGQKSDIHLHCINVSIPSYLFFNRLFLVPKPNNKWRPILDLSKLNQFRKAKKFKMETPETITTSLQHGEWISSIDFKDAYFHIPIQEQSRKYLSNSCP